MLTMVDANVEQRLDCLERSFAEYISEFNAKHPFRDFQLYSHRHTLDLLSRFKSAAEAARDELFADSLAATLKSWDIGLERHSSSLVPPQQFRAQLRGISLAVGNLEHLRIDDPAVDADRTAHLIWLMIRDLNIVEYKGEPTKRKIVSGTKTLHHLLPNLVFPIDNEYTGTFFKWADSGRRPEEHFKFVFRRMAALARSVDPQSYVGEGWNTSCSKVLDNSIIGFNLAEGLISRSKKTRRRREEQWKMFVNLLEQLGRKDLLEPGRTVELIEFIETIAPPMQGAGARRRSPR